MDRTAIVEGLRQMLELCGMDCGSPSCVDCATRRTLEHAIAVLGATCETCVHAYVMRDITDEARAMCKIMSDITDAPDGFGCNQHTPREEPS